MLTLRRYGSGDVEMVLLCGGCGRRLRITEAWLAWPVNGLSEPKWLHRSCANGACASLFQRDRILLWRATDALSRLLRQTETEGGR